MRALALVLLLSGCASPGLREIDVKRATVTRLVDNTILGTVYIDKDGVVQEADCYHLPPRAEHNS